MFDIQQQWESLLTTHRCQVALQNLKRSLRNIGPLSRRRISLWRRTPDLKSQHALCVPFVNLLEGIPRFFWKRCEHEVDGVRGVMTPKQLGRFQWFGVLLSLRNILCDLLLLLCSTKKSDCATYGTNTNSFKIKVLGVHKLLLRPSIFWRACGVSVKWQRRSLASRVLGDGGICYLFSKRGSPRSSVALCQTRCKHYAT